MSEIPEGYREIPEQERKKAQAFFQRGRTVADTGNYDYAIEMYLQGLAIDPDAVEAHQSLRDISLRRKASGGKDLGMFQKMKLRMGKDEKQNLLTAERLLAFDPGNTDHMAAMMQNAQKGGFYDTAMWIGPILFKANREGTKEDVNKYLLLKDTYKQLKQWKLATEACHEAVRLKGNDMDLMTELKNLGAQETMSTGGYETSKSFRDSVRNADAQQRLLTEDKGVHSDEGLVRLIRQAQVEYDENPQDTSKLSRLIDLMTKTEDADWENRAIEILEREFQNTKQYKFRYRANQIKLAQLNRLDRSMRQAVQQDPADASLKEQYREFAKERAEQELEIYKEASDNYPTDAGLRYNVAMRMFRLEHYDEAIPLFQQVRQDPKFRTDAGMALGQAFLAAGFIDEAVDTLRDLISNYALKGDERSVDMTYWYGRALEQQGDTPQAIKAFSQVAQWDFNYRDVQARIKKLRAAAQPQA